MTRILVAEDDANLRALIVEMLSQAGYETHAVGDGQEGLDVLKRTPVDMVVMDLNMPRLDGIELCRKIRGDPKLKGLPVLILTVRTMADDMVLGYDSGADDYLIKPFEKEVLLARLKTLERRLLHK